MHMKSRPLLISFLVIVLMLATGCAGPQTAPAATSTAVPATSTAAGSSTATPETLPSPADTLKSTNSCTLINSADLAHLLPPHNEIVRDVPKTGPVSHPPFSEAAAAGTETQCAFYDFHQPGQQAGWMLQVTYLLDAPEPTALQAWSQAWADAKASAGQPVSDLGDGAFAGNAKLFIKAGDAYITFEAVDTRSGADAASPQQLVAYEVQLAAAGLSRLN